MHRPVDPGPRTARRGRGVVAVLASIIAVLVAVGLGLTVALISHAQSVAAATPADMGVAKDASFGTVRLAGVDRISPMDMNDMPTVNGSMVDMGMGNGDVPAGSIALICDVVLTNTQSHPVSVSQDQFTLLRATTKGAVTVKPNSTNLAAASKLPPNASIEAKVTFIVPEDGAPLRMVFADTPAKTSLLFDAGRTDQAPAGSEHHHH